MKMKKIRIESKEEQFTINAILGKKLREKGIRYMRMYSDERKSGLRTKIYGIPHVEDHEPAKKIARSLLGITPDLHAPKRRGYYWRIESMFLYFEIVPEGQGEFDQIMRRAAGEFVPVVKEGYLECPDCEGLVLSDDDQAWLGEDESGRGSWSVTYRCEDCGRWRKDIEPE
jgi:hypothetical protein